MPKHRNEYASTGYAEMSVMQVWDGLSAEKRTG